MGLDGESQFEKRMARFRKRAEEGGITTKSVLEDIDKVGDNTRGVNTPSEILFEIQRKARGFIEIDIALRTTDPFKYDRKVLGNPIRIRGLDPGEIWKLKSDLEGLIIKWRSWLIEDRRERNSEKTPDNDGDVEINTTGYGEGVAKTRMQ